MPKRTNNLRQQIVLAVLGCRLCSEVRDLSECSARWDWRYGAASIKTPEPGTQGNMRWKSVEDYSMQPASFSCQENDTLYVQRVVEAVRTLKAGRSFAEPKSQTASNC